MSNTYKFDCVWKEQDGWYFSFGTKRMWQNGPVYIVADYIGVEGINEYQNHKQFKGMEKALTYMRTGKE